MTRVWLLLPVFSYSEPHVFTDNDLGDQAIPFDPDRRARAASRTIKLGMRIDHADLPSGIIL